jgi:large subunit ribosomal protein L3
MKLMSGANINTGAVPGPKNQIIKISDAKGKPWPKGPMAVADVVPASIAVPGKPAAATVTA